MHVKAVSCTDKPTEIHHPARSPLSSRECFSAVQLIVLVHSQESGCSKNLLFTTSCAPNSKQTKLETNMMEHLATKHIYLGSWNDQNISDFIS